MSRTKSLVKAVGISLGGIGVVVCIASMIFVWIVSNRLGRVAESLFGSADRSMVAVRQRIVQTQKHVSAAKITSADVESSLADWTRQETRERLALTLNASERTGQLASNLQQADIWLQVAESSVALVREALSIGSMARSPEETAPVDRLSEEIASLRAELTKAKEFVDKIDERITDMGDEQSLAERIEQAAQIALRVAATLGSIESRLDKFDQRLSVARSQLGDLEARTQRWVQLVAIGVTLLLLWMMAGQAALCRLAWNDSN